MSQELDKSASIVQDRNNNSEIQGIINNFHNQQESYNNDNFYYKNEDTDNSKINDENFFNKNKDNYPTRTKNDENINYNTNLNYDVESTLSKMRQKEYSQSNNLNVPNYSFNNPKLSKLENEYIPKNLRTLNPNLNESHYEEPETLLRNRAATSKNDSEFKANLNNNYNINLTTQNNSRQDLNRMTESNTNVNFLPTQSNNYNPNTIHKTSVSNEESNKILMQVMEKDKIIFEYSKLLKETERMLEKNKKQNADKDEQISKCRDEIKELKFKIRNSENLIQKKDEEFEKYKNHTEEKFLNINKEKALFEEKYNDLAKLFENNHSDFQNTVFEYKKMENNMDRLRQQIQEKEEAIRSNEKFIEELKKEIKQIPNLKKEIIDLENIIKNLNKELIGEKNLNDKIIQNTNEAEKKLSVIIEESKQGKELMNNYLKISFECENLKKELEFKDKEIETMNDRYKALMKENDNFVQHFTKEITDFNCLMENINYAKNSYSTSNINLNNSNIAMGANAISEKFSLKYEILNKNFDGLRKKYVESYNQNLMIINKFERSLGEIEKINKEIMNERDVLIKELTITKQNYKDSATRIEDLNDDNDKMNENYKNLRDNYIKLKSEHEELQTKNENLCQETHLFLMNCNEKLKERFPEINSTYDRREVLNTNTSINKTKRTENTNITNENLNFAEKILYYLDTLINDYTKAKLSEKQLIENKTNLEYHIKTLSEERDLLNEKIERILSDKEEEIKNLDYEKNDEISRQREVLYEKISSLTELLEESNQIISSYEKENESLKEKNTKLETNLKLLTNSHMELENSINGNFVILQKENEEKDYKYNTILRELEIKDMHIQSIESILSRKEEEIEKLKETQRLFMTNYSKEQSQIYDYNNNINYQNQEYNNQNMPNLNEIPNDFEENQNKILFANSDFKKNEENEKELKKLITGSGFTKTGNSLAEMSDAMNYNFNSDDFKSTISTKNSIKVPGRIFSSKKKI